MPNERVEKRREFIINTLYFAIVALIVFVCFKYVAKWIMPFIVGFVIALSARPGVAALCKITKINRKAAGAIVILLEYALISFLIWTIGSTIYGSLKDLFTKLPYYYDTTILPFASSFMAWIEGLVARISPETMEQIYAVVENGFDGLRDYIISFSSSMLSGLAGVTTKIPFFFISFVFTILASIFISIDYKNVIEFIKKQLPPRTRVFLGDAKKHIGKTVVGYIRAYIIIWIMTFTELSIGLSILRIENAIGIAAIIAVFDILPVVGTGGIVIPWAIISLFTQEYFVAAGLIVIYVIILAVRNFTEPKIIGDQLGLNPLVTLLAIYLGYRIMGVLGMIILPVATNIFVGLQKAGKIKLWKE
jgi:sporulation integral membrane protein YtvI